MSFTAVDSGLAQFICDMAAVFVQKVHGFLSRSQVCPLAVFSFPHIGEGAEIKKKKEKKICTVEWLSMTTLPWV